MNSIKTRSYAHSLRWNKVLYRPMNRSSEHTIPLNVNIILRFYRYYVYDSSSSMCNTYIQQLYFKYWDVTPNTLTLPRPWLWIYSSYIIQENNIFARCHASFGSFVLEKEKLHCLKYEKKNSWTCRLMEQSFHYLRYCFLSGLNYVPKFGWSFPTSPARVVH